MVAALKDILWTYHGTAVVRDYDAAASWLVRMCGAHIIDFDISDHPLVSRKGGVIWLGDNGLELMEPIGVDAPAGKFMARFGQGFYGLALQIEDAHAAAKAFDAREIGWVGDPSEHFIFTRPQHTARLMFEWGSLREHWDPRISGKPPQPLQSVIPVRRILEWGALVEDPRNAVEELGQIWPLDILHQDDAAPPYAPSVVISLKDGTLGLYRLPSDPAEQATLWGTRVARPHFHHMKLEVADLAATRMALLADHIRILRETTDSITTHPDDLFGMGISWIAQRPAGS